MSTPADIREYKKELRSRCHAYRNGLDPSRRAEMDDAIMGFLTDTEGYKSTKTVLCYVSIDREIDTLALIKRMVDEGKRVGVPRCVDGSRNMDFHEIKSLDELVLRKFGLLEPDPDKSPKLTAFEDALCVVPGLAFDRNGYRIGYGGGYYDRFLSVHSPKWLIGVCYEGCVFPEIIRGHYDLPCHMLITENGVSEISQKL